MARQCGFCKCIFDDLSAHRDVAHPVCTQCSGLIRFQDRQALEMHLNVCWGSPRLGNVYQPQSEPVHQEFLDTTLITPSGHHPKHDPSGSESDYNGSQSTDEQQLEQPPLQPASTPSACNSYIRPGGGTYRCDDCGLRFPRVDRLCRHMREVHRFFVGKQIRKDASKSGLVVRAGGEYYAPPKVRPWEMRGQKVRRGGVLMPKYYRPGNKHDSGTRPG